MKENFSDGEIVAMQGVTKGKLPPDRMLAIMRWKLPSLNVREVSCIIRDAKASAPPQAFKAATDLSEARVDPSRWRGSIMNATTVTFLGTHKLRGQHIYQLQAESPRRPFAKNISKDGSQRSHW